MYVKISLDTTQKKGLNPYGTLQMLNVIDSQLPTGNTVRCRNRARQEVGATMDLPRAKKPCREPQEEGTSPGRRLLRRDRLPEVSACLAGRGIRSVAVRDEVPLDKRDVSYYSFHAYSGFTAGGAAPGKGSSGAMRRPSEICKASAMLRRLRMVGLRLPCSI